VKWLNYHHLYYFWTIAKVGGIAKAAEKLRLGQPTLSTQLKQLEDSLEHPLFERKNRSLVLTEAGKVALGYAEDIFKLGDELIQVLDDKTFSNTVEVTFGALDSVPKHIILAMAKAALKSGDCRVTILEGKGDELFRELFAHQIDLMVSNYPPMGFEQGRTYSRSFAKVPVAVFGTPKFSSLRRNFPASLEGQPFILPTSHSKLRQDLDHFFTANRIRTNLVAETQDTAIQKLMGIEGLGLLPLPEFAAQQLVSEKKLIKVGLLYDVKEEFWLVSAARKIANPMAAKLMKEFELD
jgi:LysR family transcriptional activator of nhaA